MKENMDWTALGAKLREAREYRGFSQEEVSTHLGIPRSAISLIESGTRKLDALELQKLARLYETSIEDLTGEKVQTAKDPESVKLIARAAAALSEADRKEVLQFAEFLRSRRPRKKP